MICNFTSDESTSDEYSPSHSSTTSSMASATASSTALSTASSSDEEEEVIKKRYPRRILINRMLSSSSSDTEEDQQKVKSRIEWDSVHQQNDSNDDIEIIAILPPGTTILRTDYKINDSSDTYSSNESDMDIIDDNGSVNTDDIDIDIENLFAIESVEPIVDERTPPELKAPEPQLPNSCIQMLQVRTPDTEPQETTVWKNGQAIKVPPPPKLPPYLILRVINWSETIEEIKKRLNSSCDEIEAIDQTMKISLICPITNQRVKTPSRSIKCHHFDCFDINSFFGINYNKKTEDWKCPKCKQPAQTYHLIIDSLIWHILTHKSVEPSVEAIIFDNKALWVPDIKYPEIHPNQNNDPNVINILDVTEDIIELDDDEEPETVPVPSKPKKVKLTLPTPKSVEPNLWNQTNASNQQNCNQMIGMSGDPQYDEILQLLRSAEQEIDRGGQRVTRWSNNSVRLPPPTIRIPVIPSVDTSRNAAIRPQLNSHRSSAQMTQQSRPQMQNIVSQPPSRRPPTAASVNSSHTSTNSVSQNSNDCNLKFTFGSDGALNVFCPLCNESFSGKAADQHKSSAKHKALLNSSVRTPINKTQPNIVRPVLQNNRNPQPIQQIRATRPPVRTYSNPNYASNTYNNMWNQYPAPQQPQPLYNTPYQMAYPPSSITNNFYAQPPPYIQQVAPPAHQSNVPPPGHTNLYNNPNQTTYYPTNPNQPNGYYNYQ